jgi:hypothetical protein
VMWWREGVARERWEVLVLEDQTRTRVEVDGFERDDRSTDQTSRQQMTDVKRRRRKETAPPQPQT